VREAEAKKDFEGAFNLAEEDLLFFFFITLQPRDE